MVQDQPVSATSVGVPVAAFLSAAESRFGAVRPGAVAVEHADPLGQGMFRQLYSKTGMVFG